MLLEKERAEVVRVCQEMARLGLVVGTAGNVSVRVGDQVAISPSGMAYEDLEPADVGIHDLDGAPVDARWSPSSELPLHLAVYRATDVGAITHNHAPASTALRKWIYCSHCFDIWVLGFPVVNECFKATRWCGVVGE